MLLAAAFVLINPRGFKPDIAGAIPRTGLRSRASCCWRRPQRGENLIPLVDTPPDAAAAAGREKQPGE